jgi:hypothetical protein
MSTHRTTKTRHVVAVLAAGAFGVAAPLTVASLSDAAVHHPSRVRDSDGDKMPDRWESANGLNPHKANARKDADRDGLKNLGEFRDGTDPLDDDSDNDGVEDGDDDTPDGDCEDSRGSGLQNRGGADDCQDETDEECTDTDTDVDQTDDADDLAGTDDACDDDAGARIATYVVR